jgi:hypothetical protein
MGLLLNFLAETNRLFYRFRIFLPKTILFKQTRIMILTTCDSVSMKTKFCNFSRFNLVVLLLLFAATHATAFATRYVKVAASGLGDGSSWANASADLQAMIQASASGDAVWVAAGTYLPTNKPYNGGVEINTTDLRDKTFHVKDGVKLFGGFGGIETDTSQRNLAVNTTILSGDIGAAGNADNCYHVVVASMPLSGVGVTINGFTIQGGNANGGTSITINGNAIQRNSGGGIFTALGTNTLSNNIISSNSASNYGGGIYTVQGTNTLTHNIISSNSTLYGGGIYMNQGANTLTHNIISSNSASFEGGGIFTLQGANTLSNNIISSNSATSGGGGINMSQGANTLTHNIISSNSAVYGGGIYQVGDGSNQNMRILNCVFYDNSATAIGGAIAYDDMNAPGTLQITNATFYNNRAPAGSGGAVAIIFWDSGHLPVVLKNCLLWGNSGSVNARGSFEFQNCLIQESACPSNGTCSNMIYNQDPLFVNSSNPNGADNRPRTADDGLRLQAGSPCVNAGIAVAGVTTDILGNAYSGNPDLGAYEYQVSCTMPTTYVVTGGGASCAGGTGVLVGLANSEIGVNYQLKNTGTAVGSVVAGTGSALAFGAQSVAGTYTVDATTVSGGCTATMTGSAEVSVTPTVTPSITIAASPSGTIITGTSVTFTATPTNGGATPVYQWQLNGANVGINSATYTNAALTNGAIVTCVLTPSSQPCLSAATATSTGITMTVVPPVTPAVSIAIMAGRQTTCANMIVSFTATPTHGGASPVYQWKRNGVDVGTNSDTYTTRTLTHGESVTCVMTSNAVGASPTTATSNSIVMTVIQYANGTITNGATATFCGTGLLTGSPSNAAAYQWKRNGADIPSATTSTYNATASGNYTLAITVLPGSCSMITGATAVAILPLPTATITPATPTTFCQGGSVVLNANTGTGFAYQWKRNNANLNNETQANYTATTAGDYAVAITDVAGNGCTNTAATTVTVNALPTLTVTSPNNAICNGATELLTANPVGGGGTYTYRWNDNSINARLSVTPNANATYSVTVTDANNCVATNSKSLIVNALPSLVVRSTTPILCNGGASQCTFGSNLGTAPFQYGLNGLNYQSNNLFELAAGTKRIWVRDANNCIDSMGSVTLTQPALLTVSAPTAAALVCYDGFTNLQSTATGGTTPYQYSLNGFVYQAANSFSVQGGTYQIAVKDVNGCQTASSLYTVVRPADLVVTTVTNPIKCWGETTQTTIQVANAVAPIQYALNGVAQNNDSLYKGLPVGNYAVRVTDNRGCVKQASFTLTQPPLLAGSITVDTLICKGKTTPIVVKTTGGTGAVQYRLNEGTFENSLAWIGSGTHTVQIRDANQCLKTLPSVKIEEGVAKTDGLRNLTINCHETDMRIYPNPVVDVMAVDFKISEQSDVKILIYNSLGDLIAQKDYLTIDAGNYTTSWDTSNWAANFVRVCLEVDGTCVQVTSIMIVH